MNEKKTQSQSQTNQTNTIIHSGFRAYVIEDWLLESSRVVKILLEETGREEDVVNVAVYKVAHNANQNQLQILSSVFFKPPVEGVHTKETQLGVAFVVDPTHSFQNVSFVQIPDGDCDRYLSILEYQLNLKRLTASADRLSFDPKP